MRIREKKEEKQGESREKSNDNKKGGIMINKNR